MKAATLLAVSVLAVGMAVATGPASALPTTPIGVAGPDDGVVTQVRWRRHHRHHYRHHRRWRHGGSSRRAAPSQAGNAKDPSRPIRQQNQGMTTGGPRY